MIIYNQNVVWRAIALVVLILSANFGYAQIANNSLDLQQVKDEINIIDEKIKNNQITSREKFALIQQIERMQSEMNACINNNQGKLKSINKLLDTGSSIDKDDVIYLKAEKNNYSKLTSSCNFYAYRLQEINDALQSKTPQDEKSHLFQQSPTFPELLSELKNRQVPNQLENNPSFDVYQLTLVNTVFLLVILSIGFIFKLIILKHKKIGGERWPYLNSISDLPWTFGNRA